LLNLFWYYARIDVVLSLKSKLKEFGWLNKLNARYKSSVLKREYGATVARYASMPQSRSFQELIREHPVGNVRSAEIGRQLRIFFLGTDEQQDRSGTLQALAKISDLTYFTRADGSYGQNDPALPLIRKRANTERLWELIDEQADRGKPPDILIAQTWACLIEPEIFTRIRQSFGTVIINISMDDRHQYWGEKINGNWGGTFPLIPHIDLALTAAPECADWYMKDGCPSLFFPEASDPDIFHPMPELPKTHDVCFVGGCYGIREKIVDALRNAGIRVSAFGSGWKSGRIDIDLVPKLFAQSKIILGIGTIGHCKDFYALKMRDFDAPMSGSFYITHDNHDLNLVYHVGQEIMTYTAIPDCVDKIRYFIEHDRAREEIAQQGWKRATGEHTWSNRFGGLLSVL
jgi:spore maturation protein CgeB